MSRLLSPDEFLKLVDTYRCGPFLQRYLTGIILEKGNLTGRYRTYVVIKDCRARLVLGRFPDLYMKVGYRFEVRPGSPIINPNHPELNENRVLIGFEAVEEMTKEEFEAGLNDYYSDEFVKEANKVINPDKDET